MKTTQFVSWLTPLLVLSLVCSFAFTADAQNYYPLEVGNTWILESTDGAEKLTYSITGPEVINGQELNILNIATSLTSDPTGEPTDLDKYFVTLNDEGILLHQTMTDEGAFGIAEATFDPPAIFFPAALPVGHQWEVVTETELQLAGPVTSTSTIEVVAIEDVETPAGIFQNCVKLDIKRKAVTALAVVRYEFLQWLAPDVGPIKFQNVLQDVTFELQSYDLVEPQTAEDAPAAEDAPSVEETPPTEEASTETEEASTETPEEPAPEEPMPEPVVDGPAFDITLEPGLNMISIPLMPAEPYTAKSLAEMLDATAVIQLDTATQSFMGYTVADDGDGFGITGDKGYIVNTPSGGMVKFTGDAWDNQPEQPEKPEVEADAEVDDAEADDAAADAEVDDAEADAGEADTEADAGGDAPEGDAAGGDAAGEDDAADAGGDAAPAAPTRTTYKSAWAFIVTSDIQGMETGTAYTLVAENLRTGTIATENITNTAKRSSAVWADLNRKSVVEAGDKLKVALYDDNNRIVSGPFQRTVTTGDIHNAFLSLQLRVGDVQPQDTLLAQNFPNPFNPETWIPYQLSEATEVKIDIYDVSGRLVRSLDLGWQPTGSYMAPSSAAYWDGRNAVGERVASGIYFYTLQTSDFTATRRMVILK